MKKKFMKHSTPAQTMVEFALVLPILLALVFGLFEVGRMAFTYITIVTASREAVRYGSATGDVTIINSNNKRFADCVGIRKAAMDVNFLNTFKESDIVITYDKGLYSNGTVNEWPEVGCQGGLTPPISLSEADKYKYRINVSVTGTFTPIIDILNLLSPGSSSGSTDDIVFNSLNSHTILGNVPIDKPWVGLNTPTGGGGCGTCGGGQLATATLTPTVTNTPLPSPTSSGPTSPPPTRTPNSCKIDSSKPVVNEFYTELQWDISTNTAVTIANMSISWPEGSGNLLSVKIDGNLIPLNLIAPTQNISGTQLTPYQNLAVGSHTFIFEFNNNPLGGVFQVSLAFSEGHCSPTSGSLTLYPVTHSGSFPNAGRESKIAGPWSIYNHTNKVLNITYVKIIWNSGNNCSSTADLTKIEIASNVSTLLVDKSNCNGYNITPVNWTIPAGTSIMNLTFSADEVRNIKVELGLTGKINSPESYILDSSNPMQKQ